MLFTIVNGQDQIFPISAQAPDELAVKKVLPGGKLQLGPSNIENASGAVTTTEGWYLALTGTRVEDGPPINSRLFRVHVDEVLVAGSYLVTVDATEKHGLTTASFVYLLRPSGSTTAEIKAVPSGIKIETKTAKTEGVDEGLARRIATSRLQRIGVAMARYEEHNGEPVPQAIIDDTGKPLFSWRVLLLPYFGEREADLFDQFDLNKAWDDAHNLALLKEMPEVYHNPFYGQASGTNTHFAMITGSGTAARTTNLKDVPSAKRKENGIAEPLTIQDGRSSTILLGPVAENREISWSSPVDIAVPQQVDESFRIPFAMPWKDESRSGEGVHRGGLFLMADYSVIGISSHISLKTFLAMCTIDGGEVIPQQGEEAIPLLPPPISNNSGFLRVTTVNGEPVAFFVKRR